MMYFLDSNVCIEYMREGKAAKAIKSKFVQHGLKEGKIMIPAIVVAELMHGAYKSKRPDETLEETLSFLEDFSIVSFGEDEADMYGQIRANLERRGLLIGNNDMLIAATALTYNATLITNNTNEFSRIDGLKLEDWTI